LSVTIIGIDHVQIAAPPGREDDARSFYGGLLGMDELRKPEPIRARGGCWFAAGAQELHVGVEEPFAPARKAHPGLLVSDLDALRGRLAATGVVFSDDAKIDGVDRLFVDDPFGNRLELRAARRRMV
jgi:catechol 2,3-dioxygenase-like lactoylglutathione lyase family enzyme